MERFVFECRDHRFRSGPVRVVVNDPSGTMPGLREASLEIAAHIVAEHPASVHADFYAVEVPSA